MQVVLESNSATAGHDPKSSPLDTAFAKLVEDELAQWNVPGIAIGVVDGDNVWHQGYGLRDISGQPMTTSTNFYAGSTTKAFTTAALAQLVSDEALPHVHWRSVVSELIREDFVLSDAWATANLTLEDILTHRTGMPVHDQAHGRAPTKDTPHDAPRPAVREIVRQLRHLPLTASPRSTYQYCNLMYIAASHVIESLTGQWLGKYLQDQIWTPLHMPGTYFATEDALRSDEYPLAKGYRFDEDQKAYVEVPFMDLDGTSGAGSVISNVRDYTTWARAVMDQSDLLDATQWTEIFTPRTVVDAGREPDTGPSTYALGWKLHIYKGHRMVSHNGAMHAYGALFIVFPDLRYSVVAFANTAISSIFAAETLVWRLIDDRLDVPKLERFDWDKKNRAFLATEIDKARNAHSRLYPHIADPPLPLSLPLAWYTGVYFEPGYQKVTVELTDKPPSKFLQRFMTLGTATQWLVADRKDFTWPEFLTFEHVSGDHFIAWAEHNSDYGAWYPDAHAVKFAVGADGTVMTLLNLYDRTFERCS